MSDTLMMYTPILSQYVLGTLAFSGLVSLVFLPMMKRRNPRTVLMILVGMNMLRFGGVAGAVAAMASSKSPGFLAQVAVGDGVTALLAVMAFVLLLRKSERAGALVVAMNVAGLAGILVSEGWLGVLEFSGDAVGDGVIHGPSIGAAIFTTVHGLVFYFRARAESARQTWSVAARGLTFASPAVSAS